MEKRTCKNCTYFHQHYVIDEQSCTSVNCGHCTHPRLKTRTPLTPACAYFVLREPSADLPGKAAVTHYLTTEVLRYILSLELPPDITPL